jgi:hypothetical protein
MDNVNKLCPKCNRISNSHLVIWCQSYKFEDIKDEAKKGLITYRKLYPDAIAFFAKTDWNKIKLKCWPLHSILRAYTK